MHMEVAAGSVWERVDTGWQPEGRAHVSQSKWNHLAAGERCHRCFYSPWTRPTPCPEQPLLSYRGSQTGGHCKASLRNQGLGVPPLLPSPPRGPASLSFCLCTRVLCLLGSVVDKWVPSTQSTPAPLSGLLFLDRSTMAKPVNGLWDPAATTSQELM